MLMIRGDKEDMSSLIDYLKEHKKIVIIAIIGGIVLASIPVGIAVAKKVIAVISKTKTKNTLTLIKKNYGSLITKWATAKGVPASLLASVILSESAGVKNVGRREPGGQRCYGKNCYRRSGDRGISYGLMQIMDWHLKTFGLTSGQQLFDPNTNIKAGATILKGNYDKFKSWPLAVMAYNTGPGNVTKSIRAIGSRDWETIYANRSKIPVKATRKWTMPYLRKIFGLGGVHDIAKTLV